MSRDEDRPGFRKPFEAVPITVGKRYRRHATIRRGLQRLKSAGLFGGVAAAVFASGWLVTNMDGMAIPGAAWVRVPAADSACPSISVHDGDTIRCGRERVRLADIDAPELAGSPRCEGWRAARSWCDDALARRSRDALRAFLATGHIELRRQGQDKYGRTLATVSVNGVSAGARLVELGLARPYRR